MGVPGWSAWARAGGVAACGREGLARAARMGTAAHLVDGVLRWVDETLGSVWM